MTTTQPPTTRDGEALGSLSRLSVDGVRAWLREKVGADERIQELFVLNGIDGKALQSLGDAELLAMGVETDETRRRMLSAISAASSSAKKDEGEGLQGQMDFGEFLLVETQETVLGRGNFGEVLLGSLNGTPVALKSLSGAPAADFFAEVAVLQRLRHPNVVQFFGIANRPALFMVMELANGSVLNLVREKELDQKTLVSFARDCAAGMDFLSSKRIIHRDIAARNLLYFRTGDGYIGKVGDFGLSRCCPQTSGSAYYRSQNGQCPLKWTAPEALREHKFTEKSDVWSFGVVLWELFSRGAEPYGFVRPFNVAEMLKVLENLLVPPVGCDPEIAQIMRSCWNFDPMHRPTFEKLRRQLSPQQPGGSGPTTSQTSDHVAGSESAYCEPLTSQVSGYMGHLNEISQSPQPQIPSPPPQPPAPVCTLDFEAEKKKGLEGIRNIISALKTHAANADVCNNACVALGDLAYNNDENKVLIAREGGVPLIIATLKTHAADSDVCDSACAALRNLAVNNDENKVLIARSGGIPLIIATLKTHATNADVCNSACGALWNLALNDENMVLIAREGGIPPIISALKTHAENADVFNNACVALGNLAFNDENRMLIAREGGIPPIIAALKTHAANAGVCNRACGALGNLAVNGENSVLIAREGGIPPIIAALKTHAANAGVCNRACGALGNLAVNDENRVLIAREGGIPPIIAALKTHAANAGVCDSACVALLSLALNGENKVLIACEGGIPPIISALKTHAADADVCNSACVTLRSLAFNNYEIKVLIAREIDLDPVLSQFHSKIFPGFFQLLFGKR